MKFLVSSFQNFSFNSDIDLLSWQQVCIPALLHLPPPAVLSLVNLSGSKMYIALADEHESRKARRSRLFSIELRISGLVATGERRTPEYRTYGEWGSGNWPVTTIENWPAAATDDLCKHSARFGSRPQNAYYSRFTSGLSCVVFSLLETFRPRLSHTLLA